MRWWHDSAFSFQLSIAPQPHKESDRTSTKEARSPMPERSHHNYTKKPDRRRPTPFTTFVAKEPLQYSYI